MCNKLQPDPAGSTDIRPAGLRDCVLAGCLGPAAHSEVTATLRQARRGDIPAMHRVRLAVTENQLTSSVITEEDYLPAIEETGRGWVVEVAGEIVAFAIGNAQTGNIWAMFVDPAHEGRGYGRRLHDEMVGWLWSRGLERLWLTTGQRTRAQRFYELAGWQNRGALPNGELLFERHAPAACSSGKC